MLFRSKTRLEIELDKVKKGDKKCPKICLPLRKKKNLIARQI